MKKITKVFALAAAAVAMLSGCQKEAAMQKEQPVARFTVTAGSVDTKTEFVDGANPYVKWNASDAIRVYEFADGAYKYYHSSNGTTLSDSDKKATFTVDLYGTITDPVEEYTYAAVYPANGVNKSSDFYFFEIPSSQTLSNGVNLADGADVLISKPVKRATRIGDSEDLIFNFKRPGTVVALSLKGITAGETISKVTLTAPTGVDIVGRSKINLTTGEVYAPAYYGGKNYVDLITDLEATGTDIVYFRILDGTWTSGSAVSINVETDVATYSKTVNLPKDYVFADGGLTKFGFSSMTREEKSADVYKSGTDVITSADLEATSSSYVDFSGVSKETNAVYAGESAKHTSGAIQLRSSDSKAGLVTTKTSGYVTSISVTWNSNTAAGRIIDVYGKDSAYTSGADLYDNSKKGDKLGSITCGTSTTLEIDGAYNYIGLRSNNGAMYLDDISIVWSADVPKEKLDAPEMDDPAGDDFAKTILVGWTDVANATGYVVSCTGAADQNIAPGVEVCEFTGLTAGEKTITVKAVDSSDTYAPASSSKTITLYNPSITLSTLSIDNVPAASDDYNDITYTLDHATDADVTWTCDGTVVDEVIATSGSVLYTVNTNTGDARDGWIKATLNGATQTITISQLAQGAASPVLTKLKDITGVPATGAVGATESGVYSLENAAFGDLTVTPDGTIVTAASTSAAGSITYSVAANTGAARTGHITLSISGAPSITIDVAQAAGAATPKYVKITSTSDLSDGKYLIVYENGDEGWIFTGIDGTSNYYVAAISDNSIASTTAVDAYAVSISSGYTIKIENGDNSGKYIYGKSGSNTIVFNATSQNNTITFNGGLATILSNSTSLRFNTLSGQDRFRYYKTTTTGSNYHEVALYKKITN